MFTCASRLLDFVGDTCICNNDEGWFNDLRSIEPLNDMGNDVLDLREEVVLVSRERESGSAVLSFRHLLCDSTSELELQSFSRLLSSSPSASPFGSFLSSSNASQIMLLNLVNPKIMLLIIILDR